MRNVIRVQSSLACLCLFLLAGCPATVLDDYEPNDALAVFFDLGSVTEGLAERSWSATISPDGDRDFYGFLAEEASDVTEIPLDEELFTLVLRLVPPQAPDARNYDLYLYSESGSLLDSSTNPDSAEETIVYTWDGVVGLDDSLSFRMEVRGAEGDDSTSPYTLHGSLGETFP
jgi:hypothetical protein